MNKLDRRFIEDGMFVFDVANDEPSNANDKREGVQYIVGENPTGAFAGATPNSIARYDGSEWKFTMPRPFEFVFNWGEDKFIYWDNKNIPPEWHDYVNIQPKWTVMYAYFVSTGTKLPTTCAEGDQFLNLSTGMLYIATGESTWDEGHNVIDNTYDYFIDLEANKSYKSNGTKFSDKYPDACFFTDVDNHKRHSLYFATGGGTANNFIQLYPLPEQAGSLTTATETHVLTASEVTGKGFTLSQSVKTGKEGEVLCFVQGLAQAAGIAFSVSGNSLSWNGKTLDGNVSSGDVFIVQYIKASA